jgi:hypothetical protein
MAHRPASKKLIAEIEAAIPIEAETFLRLKAELDAVSTGVYALDMGNPKYCEAAKRWNDFAYKMKASNFIEVVYS